MRKDDWNFRMEKPVKKTYTRITAIKQTTDESGVPVYLIITPEATLGVNVAESDGPDAVMVVNQKLIEAVFKDRLISKYFEYSLVSRKTKTGTVFFPITYCENRTVDIVLVCPKDKSYYLIRRKDEKRDNTYAVAGGFIDSGEDPKDAAVRELKEELIFSENALVMPLCGKIRDITSAQRGREINSFTYPFIAVLDGPPASIKAGDDAAEVHRFEIGQIPPLSFFHHQSIIEEAFRWTHENYWVPNDWWNKCCFDEAISMGNGEASEELCNLLHDRVDEGLETLSVMQQDTAIYGTSHHFAIEDRYLVKEKKIKDVIVDVAAAFGYQVDNITRLHDDIPF